MFSSTPTDIASLEAALAELGPILSRNPNDPIAIARRNELNALGDKFFNVIATVEIGKGHQVKFYDRGAGVRAIAELRGNGDVPVLEGRAQGSFAEVYRALQPGLAVPAALVESDARSATEATLQLGSSFGAEGVGFDPALPSSEKHATSDCLHFKSHDGCPQGGYLPWCGCNLDEAYTTWGDATRAEWRVGSYVGSVSVRLTVGGTHVGTFAIAETEMFGIATFSGKVVQHRGKIEAYHSADRYHYGGVFIKP